MIQPHGRAGIKLKVTASSGMIPILYHPPRCGLRCLLHRPSVRVLRPTSTWDCSSLGSGRAGKWFVVYMRNLLTALVSPPQRIAPASPHRLLKVARLHFHKGPLSAKIKKVPHRGIDTNSTTTQLPGVNPSQSKRNRPRPHHITERLGKMTKVSASRGDRTHSLGIKSPTLYRLS